MRPLRRWFLVTGVLLFVHACASNPFSKVGGQTELPNELAKFEVMTDLPSPTPKPSPTPTATPPVKGKKRKKGEVKVAEPTPSPGPVATELEYPSRRPEVDPLAVGEEAIYEVIYWPISAGDVFIETLPYKVINERQVYHIRWRVVSSSAANLLYRVNDMLESYMDYDGLFTHRFHQVLDESKQSKDAIEIYDQEKAQTFFWVRHSRAEGYTEKREYLAAPRFAQDWVSALYYLRMVPYRIGVPILFPLIFEGKVWEGIVIPEKRETISTVIGSKKAIVMRLEPKIDGRNVGVGRAWYSDDESRVLLKLEVKVKIGAIVFRLRQYKPGTPPS